MNQPRILILACSAKKTSSPGPAIEVYDGPMWKMVRKALWEIEIDGEQGPEVWALSAKYGLIPAYTEIEPYDSRMTTSRAEALRPDVLKRLVAIRNRRPAEVYIEVGTDYLEALPPGRMTGQILGCRVIWGLGRIGERMHALKEWLIRRG